MGMIFCHGCGKEIHESAKSCPHCGASQQVQQQADPKSQNIALVLAALLGAFGAHRFYLGKIASGVFYFLFCWTGIPGLIAFIECFMIAFSSQQDWAKKYNNGTLTPPVHIVLKILMLIFPAILAASLILGIVAAVAIPAYQEYGAKSKVAHGIESLNSCKMAAEIFYSKNGRFPTSLYEAGCSIAPSSGIKGGGIASGANAVEITVLFEGGKLNGESVSFAAFNASPGQPMEWKCVSATIPKKYLGKICEEQLDWVTSVHAAETEAALSTKPPAPAQQHQEVATAPAPASDAPAANAETTTPSQPVAESAPAAAHIFPTPDAAAPAATTTEAAAGTSFAPSFDCAKVSSGSERMICSNKELAAADVKLMQVYRDAVSRTTNKDGLKKMQNEWRKMRRDACSDADCMLKVYNERIVELSN